MGLSFPNRVGLAAGFDKNAVAVDGLGALGFGFVEVGTVTPRPQAGQSRPRLFRLPASGALLNRLGFPNDGAEAIAARLRRRRFRGIVGVNIGKNAATPIERAVDDSVSCLRLVHGVADYVAVNVSSPNTAQLRGLQAPARLEPLLTALLAERARLAVARPLPLLLKIAPDLSGAELGELARLVTRLGVDGVIASNTTLGRASLAGGAAGERGGISGAPLRAVALEVVAALRAPRAARGDHWRRRHRLAVRGACHARRRRRPRRALHRARVPGSGAGRTLRTGPCPACRAAVSAPARRPIGHNAS